MFVAEAFFLLLHVLSLEITLPGLLWCAKVMAHLSNLQVRVKGPGLPGPLVLVSKEFSMAPRMAP